MGGLNREQDIEATAIIGFPLGDSLLLFYAPLYSRAALAL